MPLYSVFCFDSFEVGLRFSLYIDRLQGRMVLHEWAAFVLQFATKERR